MIEVVIQRVDGGPALRIEHPELVAEAFFRLDPSSRRPDGIDQRLGSTDPNRIVREDLRTINSTFVARSPAAAWQHLFEAGELPWLKALDPGWDLIALDKSDWRRFGCRDRLVDAFEAIRGPYRAQAVATKILHLKRWHLVPVLDSLVAFQLGAPSSTPTIALVEHLRAEGRANLDGLRYVQSYLAERDIDRSYVRILDALIWTSHPATLTHPLIGLIRDWTAGE
jgi:Family of unknown function (DUF6308)